MRAAVLIWAMWGVCGWSGMRCPTPSAAYAPRPLPQLGFDGNHWIPVPRFRLRVTVRPR